jgi:class 3 adenylate cyclase/tetratricopeptide (TPR) repeat protein
MARLDAYIPIDRRFALTRDEALSDRAEGAVLFADISGFSSTASALERELGSGQGADELMIHVNQLYTELVNQVHLYGGSVIGFSGDAITCWFDQKRPKQQDSQGNSAQRATACALVMQEVVGRISDRELTTRTRFLLSIKVSVVAGTVRRFLVGSPHIQSLEILAGGLLERAAAADHILQPGQVVVGAEVLGRFGQQLQLSEWVQGANGEHFALITGLMDPVAPTPWPDLPQIDPGTARKWLLAPVYRRLQRGEEEFLAELRPSIAIFLKFSGINYDADDDAGKKLDVFVRWVQKVLEQYGGYLLQVSVGDKGSYAMASTSAPVAHEDDSLRAVAATYSLKALPPELDFITELRAGISWGTMLIGAYGSDMRRTFSEQGSETNLAARLMEKGRPGEILVSSRVADAARHDYELRDLGALKLKGWADEVPVFAVESRKVEQATSARRDPAQAPIIGRTAELTLFRSQIQALSEGRSSGIVVEGEAGIGKSRLVTTYLQEAQVANVPTLLGSGDAVERATPFHAWRPVFRDIFKLGADETRAVVYERIMAVLPDQNDELATHHSPLATPLEHAALLDSTLALCRVEDGLVISPAADAGIEQTRELLLDILSNTFTGEGQVLILDDAQWIDSPSWALLNDARQAFAPMLTIIASRPATDDVLIPKELEALLATPDTTRLQLSALEPEESTVMVAQRLGVSTLPEPVSEFIRQRAGGHPFFSEEIAYALIDAGILQIRDNESILVTKNGDLDKLDFPSTVQGVIASRIDRLGAPTQLTLKVASVIGPTFTFENLYDVHPIAADKENLHEHLGELARFDIAVPDTSEGEAAYVFKHSLIREIAYGRLLTAQRRQLHRSVAEWLEVTHALNIAPFFPLLAHHWGRAAEARTGNDRDQQPGRKALHYAEKSGEQSLRSSAYREAISFYSETLALGSDPALEIPREQRAHWLHQLGEAYHKWGQWSDARDKLAQAAALYGRPLPSGRVRVVAGIVGQVLKQVRNRLWPGRYVGTAQESEKETILKVAHIYQTLSELSFLTNDSAFSLYAVLYGLNLSEYGGLSPELVKAYTDICVIVGLFGPRGMAEAYGERAWSSAQALDEPAVKVAAKSGIGLYQMNAGQLDEAQANLEQALQMSEELAVGTAGDRRLWGDSLGLLARTIYFRGELQRAGELYAELGGPRSGVMMHRVWALNAQAAVALREGDLDAAMAFLNQARSLPGERPEPQQEMITWAHMGIACLRRGDREQAREATDRAVALMEQVKASAYTHFEAFAAVAEVYMSLWEAHPEGAGADTKELAAAARYLCDSLRRGTTKTGRPVAWLYQGWYNFLDGHPGRAYKHWGKGLVVAEEVGMPYELGRIHLEMGRHAALDDPARDEHLRRAREIFEQIGAHYQLQRANAGLEMPEA